MATNAKNTYFESRILSADGIELVQILHQAAVGSVETARKHLKEGDIAARSSAIMKAYDIIGELAISLDHTAGGEVSRTLLELYAYMSGRLLTANMEQSDPPLAEVSKLLSTLLEGWMGCRDAAPARTETPAPVAAARPKYGYGSAGSTEDDVNEYEGRASMVAVSY